MSALHTGIKVGIADAKVVAAREGAIITHALGSCIGVTLFDPQAGVGGMLHYMLPQPGTSDDSRKHMFASTGVPALFRQAYALGAKKERLVVCAAGGAELFDDSGRFRVGERNRTILRKLLWKNGVTLAGEHTGGDFARTMILELATGNVTVRAKGAVETIWTPSS